MPLTFYPHAEDADKGSLQERIEVAAEAAQRYKAIILDNAAKTQNPDFVAKKIMLPRDQDVAFNWESMARILREAREMPEGTKTDKLKKSDILNKLAEVYETLRAAKMPKLEAVRLALINEATQLKGQG